MKTMLRLSLLLLICVMGLSFTNTNTISPLGTYGVSADDPSQITLTISEGGTFTYQDLSNQKNPIKTSGNWVQKGSKVVLISKDSHLRFHRVWQITHQGKVASARRGLCFYRLCKVAS